jgi:hypothetical protein
MPPLIPSHRTSHPTAQELNKFCATLPMALSTPPLGPRFAPLVPAISIGNNLKRGVEVAGEPAIETIRQKNQLAESGKEQVVGSWKQEAGHPFPVRVDAGLLAKALAATHKALTAIHTCFDPQDLIPMQTPGFLDGAMGSDGAELPITPQMGNQRLSPTTPPAKLAAVKVTWSATVP